MTALIAAKKLERAALDAQPSTEEIIRSREENAEQVRALKELVQMAATYGFDVTRPARTATEAVQWLYFAYLGAVKEQNGAAMSFGRNSAFLDIYMARDLTAGTLTESQAQELIDDLVIKLRIVRFLQTLYNLGPAPEPNLTVLWSDTLPDGFKRFCAQISIDTSAIQYESDDLIRADWGGDAAIACCVSPMGVGKQM